jgi:hypothetical protein
MHACSMHYIARSGCPQRGAVKEMQPHIQCDFTVKKPAAVCAIPLCKIQSRLPRATSRAGAGGAVSANAARDLRRCAPSNRRGAADAAARHGAWDGREFRRSTTMDAGSRLGIPIWVQGRGEGYGEERSAPEEWTVEGAGPHGPVLELLREDLHGPTSSRHIRAPLRSSRHRRASPPSRRSRIEGGGEGGAGREGGMGSAQRCSPTTPAPCPAQAMDTARC